MSLAFSKSGSNANNLLKSRSKGSLLELSGLNSSDRKRTASNLSLNQSVKGSVLAQAKSCAGGLAFLSHYRLEAEVFCLRFSDDGEYVACGLGNGDIKLYHVPSNSLKGTLSRRLPGRQYPCTSLSYRPSKYTDVSPRHLSTDHSTFKAGSGKGESCTSALFLASYADGELVQWHATLCQKVWSVVEEGNAINCVTYSSKGDLFATAGTDLNVRVYSEAAKAVTRILRYGNQTDTLGHSNRIFSLAWHPTDPNVLISGGWDNTIQVWNVTEEISVKSIYGPHLGGDGLCFVDDGSIIASAAFTDEKPLQLWRASTGELEASISWSVKPDAKPEYLYTIQYASATKTAQKLREASSLTNSCDAKSSSLHKFLVVGGGGANANELKVFDLSSKRCSAVARGLDGAVYSAALSPDCRILAAGTASNDLLIYSFDKNSDADFLY